MTHVANILGIKISTLTTAVEPSGQKRLCQRLRDETDRTHRKDKSVRAGSRVVREHEEFHEVMIRDAISGIPRTASGGS